MPLLDPILATPLVQEAPELWQAATESPFLEGIQSGSVSTKAFGRWLSEDYHFARGLLAFQGLMLSKAPRQDHRVLVQGLVTLDDEMSWFESHAGRLKIQLDAEPHPTCRRYTDFLVRSAHAEPYTVLAAILFGVEASYLAAWSALRAEGAYAEFIERWSTLAFGEYVAALQAIVERIPDERQPPAFRRVLEFEKEFWLMAWEG
jgi:thiaminase